MMILSNENIIKSFICAVLFLTLLLYPVKGMGKEARPDLPPDALKALYLAQKAL